jgi:NADPH:quinone reductase-like Zn-dependent oxidoreductase
VPRPESKPGEVLVRVHAADVNPLDWKVRGGYLKEVLPHSLPLSPGWDVSGVVEKVGAGVSRFKKGDEVYGKPDSSRDGAYADYLVVRESEIAFKPKSIPHVRTAAVPVAALTAWQALFDTAPGQDLGKRAEGGRVVPLTAAAVICS